MFQSQKKGEVIDKNLMRVSLTDAAIVPYKAGGLTLWRQRSQGKGRLHRDTD